MFSLSGEKWFILMVGLESGGQYWSQCYTAAVQFELVKFPPSPCAFPLSRSRSQLFSVQNVHCAYARASNINPRVEIIGL